MLLKANIFQRVIKYKRIKSWAKFTQNTALLNCPFLFIYNLTLPSSNSFPINMEGSKRITTRIDHLSWSTSTGKKKSEKKQPYDRTFVVQKYIKLLWLQPVGKPMVFIAETEQQLYLQENLKTTTWKSVDYSSYLKLLVGVSLG